VDGGLDGLDVYPDDELLLPPFPPFPPLPPPPLRLHSRDISGAAVRASSSESWISVLGSGRAHEETASSRNAANAKKGCNLMLSSLEREKVL
jgi:hypothetical protein